MPILRRKFIRRGNMSSSHCSSGAGAKSNWFQFSPNRGVIRTIIPGSSSSKRESNFMMATSLHRPTSRTRLLGFKKIPIEAVDPLTVRLRTKNPDAALLFRLTQRFITNKAAYDRLGAAAADKLALGTGPYKLKDWVRGQWFVVEKNPGYEHSDHKPTVDEIVFRNIGESEVAIASLLNREG